MFERGARQGGAAMSDHDSMQAFDAEAVATLRSTLRGPLLRPGDEQYDRSSIVWNGMIDRHPAMIVCCHGTADVIAAIDFARDHGLIVAVRGGGHNAAGYGVCDSGMMIDLSAMRAVRVDPAQRRAWVQGGATWGDVDCETTVFGLATPGGLISATGVGGLTVSGGIGWLRGTSGLCIDNMLSADVVTADGRMLRASADENPDLFWAIRGGGGNFGVVTTFEFRLQPIAPEMMFCAPAYPEERAGELLRSWRDFVVTAPQQIGSIAEFSTIPDDPEYPEEARGKRVLALAAVYDGPAAEGEAVLAPLRRLGEPLVDFSGRMPYRQIQCLYDGLFPKGRDRAYFKSLYVPELSDAVIDTFVAGVSERPSTQTLASAWYFGRVVRDVPADATAFGDRSQPWLLSFDSIWSRSEDDMSNIDWTRRLWSQMRRHSNGRLYLNFLSGHDDDPKVMREGIGAGTYERLAGIKRIYDPANLFRLNQNIPPG
jgi:FAD/FMN-containing dehydrogenase